VSEVPEQYVPVVGDRVTVRRTVVYSTSGVRVPESVHTGIITAAQPEADGWFITLDTHPDMIFTGYQFLGAGTDDRGPASLETEVTLTMPGAGTFGRLLTPDLAVAVDGSGCIVLVVTEPSGKLLRVITVTDVDAAKAALDDARAAQLAKLAEADAARDRGMDDHRRATGRLTKAEAVEWLMEHLRWDRAMAVAAAEDISRRDQASARYRAATARGMMFEGGYWQVPATGGKLDRVQVVQYLHYELRLAHGHAEALADRAVRYTERLGPERVKTHDNREFLVSYEGGFWEVMPATAEQIAR
jgi:hypothetical protein